MQEPRLTVAKEGWSPSRPNGSGVWWPALLLISVGILATALGADSARRPDTTLDAAEAIARLSLSEGSRAPATREALQRFRRTLRERPLDSRRRAQYAALLLDLGQGTADARAAAFHAHQAIALAPVTVPTLRLAARTLVRTGDRPEALRLVRRMFDFDEAAAARLLLEIEPWLYDNEWEAALPDRADAWFTWYLRLRRSGRNPWSQAVLISLRQRWPGHLPARVAQARRVQRAVDVPTLRRLLPAGEVLPLTADAASLWALRGWLAAESGDTQAAETDLATAHQLADGHWFVDRVRGEGLLLLGRFDDARDAWLGALFRVPKDRAPGRVWLLRRLARMEMQRGRAGIALGHWRAILEYEPEDRESMRRLRQLTGAAE